jgi:endoglucanase
VLDDERIFATVAAYCDLPGPTGYEAAVRERVLSGWADRVAEMRVDPVGNVLARVGGHGRRVVVDAHMDEIGFRVASITPDGFLMLADGQRGHDQPQERRYAVGQPAQVVGQVGVIARGVFAAPSGHVLTPEQRDAAHLMIGDFFVDLGLDSREAVLAAGVHPGAAVVFDVATRRLGDRAVGKAMDDRMLLAAIELLLETIDPAALPVELWVAATVQEENGLHGARAVAARGRFDAAIALDVGLTGDVPRVAGDELETRLGGGPVLVHSDSYVHYDAALTRRLLDAATGAGIAIQHATFGRYGSDGCAYLDAGVPAALVATPVRYTHTAIETVALADVRATVELLRAILTRPW